MTGPPYTEDDLKEILKCALDAISARRYDHIYDKRSGRKVVWHWEQDMERLHACCHSDIMDEEDYWGVIQDCLEIALQNPLATYKRPQQPICSHEEAEDHEMFAFVVQLPDFTRKIYTKFCLKQKSDGTWYVSIRCHT
jgi:hypothetical protein